MKARAGLIVCLFALVVGARWAVVDRFGMDLPEWDQWDAEGVNLLAPWHSGSLTLGTLFKPHNEHRVVLTKALNLGLTLANGQWDQRLESAVNSVLAALIAAGFFAWGASILPRRWHAPLFILLAALYGLPFASENVLNGFHSQQLFLVGLSFAAIAGILGSGPGSRARWPGLVFMVLAMLTMGSGFFAAAVVLGLLLFRLGRGELSWRLALPFLASASVLVAIGCLTRVSVPYHESGKAQNLADFAGTFVKSAEWPALGDNNAWLSLILWLPWGCLAWRVARGAGGAGRGAGIALSGLGAWVMLQLLATAYVRGAGGNPPPSRYVDTLIVGGIVNALAIGWLAGFGGPGRTERKFHAAMALLWLLVFVGGGVAQLSRVFRDDLPEGKRYRFYCIENVRNYLATGDEAYLRHPEIPYPGTGGFLAHLRTPPLQEWLPASVRLPLAMTGAESRGFSRVDSRRPQDAPPPPGEAAPAPGLPAGCQTLSNAIYWSSFGAGGPAGGATWASAPLSPPRTGLLKFEVAGQTAGTGAGIELKDAATGAVLASVHLDKTPGDSWRSAYVRAPSRPFVVVAHNDAQDGWIAFSQPVEIGTLSYLAWRCVKNGLFLAELSAGAALALFALYHLRP